MIAVSLKIPGTAQLHIHGDICPYLKVECPKITQVALNPKHVLGLGPLHRKPYFKVHGT